MNSPADGHTISRLGLALNALVLMRTNFLRGGPIKSSFILQSRTPNPQSRFTLMPTIQVRVKPNARESSLVEGADGVWLAKLKSPPVDGKANSELIALIAERFGCRKADVTIRTGASGRMKLVLIAET
jgi:uncharacterized protein (TIGR00251 family)